MSLTSQNVLAMGTDLGGLERFFRGVQALLQVTTSTPALAALAASHKQLHETKDVLNVTRRFMRLFRFGDSFAGAQKALAVTPDSSTAMSAEQLLDMLKGTFFGIHGLLESLTALDMAGVHVWGPRMDAKLNREALMWWTAALVCSILATLMKMVNMKAHEAVNAVDSFGSMEKVADAAAKGKAEETQMDEKAELKQKEKDESKAEDKKEGSDQNEKDTKEERDARVARRKAVLAERSRQMDILKRKLVADSLDIFIPLSGLMWVAVDPALLGGMMFVTTLMGFLETWGTY